MMIIVIRTLYAHQSETSRQVLIKFDAVIITDVMDPNENYLFAG